MSYVQLLRLYGLQENIFNIFAEEENHGDSLSISKIVPDMLSTVPIERKMEHLEIDHNGNDTRNDSQEQQEPKAQFKAEDIDCQGCEHLFIDYSISNSSQEAGCYRCRKTTKLLVGTGVRCKDFELEDDDYGG